MHGVYMASSITDTASVELGVARPGVSDSDATAEMAEKGDKVDSSWDWTTDANNPHNWPASRKWAQVAMMAPTAFLAYVLPSLQ
jgi:hypothetical protein